MNPDNHAPVSVDNDETTEVTVRITPKHKLIAKIAGAATAVAGLLAVGYKLGSTDFDFDSSDADDEDEDNSDD